MQYIFLSGEVGWEITQKHLDEKFNQLPKDDKEVTIYINTVGGDAFEGIAIYNYLKLKQSQGYHITTVATGVTASAGTVIYLAGNKNSRKIHDNSSFLIHNAWTMGIGDDNDMRKLADEIEMLNNQIAEIYAKETNISKDEALVFMKEDAMRDANWMIEHGFASEIIEYTAVATKRNLNCKINNKMSEIKLSKEDKSWFEERLNKLFNIFKPKNKIVTTGDGTELDFYELEPDAEPKVGDKANAGDTPANGEYVMPSGETYVFENGELIEIKPKADDTNEEIEALKKENAELKEQLAQIENSIKEKDEQAKELQAKLDEANKMFAEIKSKFKLDGGKPAEPNQDTKIRNRKLF